MTSSMQAQVGVSAENESAGAVPEADAMQMAAQNDQTRYMQVEPANQEPGMLAAYQGQNVDMMA
ncbi:MAG: hypothetical protein ACOCYB_03785 [Alkalispirochaeta sp.]